MDLSKRSKELISGAIAVLLLILAVLLTLLLEGGSFSTTMLPFDLDDRTISYPVLPDTFGGVVNVVVNSVVAVGLMILWLLLHKNKIGRNKTALFLLAVYLVLMGGILVNLLTNVIKVFRGGLRPHFIAGCEPNATIVANLRSKNESWVDLKTTKIICTHKGKPDFRWSFPSGHSSTAFFGAILSILIIQDLPTDISNAWSPLWLTVKASLQFCIITFSSWVAVSRLVDYHHHWWDVLAGGLLGTVFAVVLFKWFLEPVMKHISEFEDPETSVDVNAVNVKASEGAERQTYRIAGTNPARSTVVPNTNTCPGELNNFA